MATTNNLSSVLGTRSQVPNQELAKQIAAKNDKKAVQELVDNLNNKSIQSDCIKVLYELGEIKPELIAGYAKEFIAQLESKNNRMQWGAMTALDYITPENPKLIYGVITKIVDIADKGSVITRDHCVGILTKLAGIKQYADNAFELLLEQMKICPSNQLPMYAENAIPVVNTKNKASFIKVLTLRLDDFEKETKRARTEKVIKKLNK
jgi:hypothetical protein